MYYSIEKDACFNIQDMYAAAQQIVKKIVVKVGTAMLALYICTGVGYAQEVVLPSIKDIPVMEMMSAPSTSAMAFNVGAKLMISRPIIHNPSLNFSLLVDSLMKHKGWMMPKGFISSFKELAEQLSTLPFVESLARYSTHNCFVSITLVFEQGIELEVTQMPNVEDVAFSILHGSDTLLVSTATAEALTDRMLHFLNEKSVYYGVS